VPRLLEPLITSFFGLIDEWQGRGTDEFEDTAVSVQSSSHQLPV